MRARILEPSAASLAQAADALSRSQVIGMPTETVYGLAADAFDTAAVLKVFAVKARPAFDPLIVHVGMPFRDVAALAAAGLVNPDALTPGMIIAVNELMRCFWPGPLTLVLPKKPTVLDLVTSGLERVAIRMPRHPVAQELLAAYGRPLAAPSANRFGRISPTTAQHVMAELGESIDIIIDGGACEFGIESTVVGIDPDDSLTLLRPGSIAVEAIEAVIKRPLRRSTAAVTTAAMASPGQLLSHYAPRKPLFILPVPLASLTASIWRDFARNLPKTSGNISLLTVGQSQVVSAAVEAFSLLSGLKVTTQEALIAEQEAHTGEAAARNLFAVLRRLDDTVSDEVILAEPIPSNEGLWLAVADRLRRASYRADS